MAEPRPEIFDLMLLEPTLGPVHDNLRELKQLHHAKLWKQVTDNLVAIMEHKCTAEPATSLSSNIAAGTSSDIGVESQTSIDTNISQTQSWRPWRLELFTQYIAGLHAKLNPLKFAELALRASQQIGDAHKAIDMLTDLVSRESTTQTCRVLVNCELARRHLALGETRRCHEMLLECRKCMDSLDYVGNTIYAHYYKVSAEWGKAKGEYSHFYKTCMLYLACIDLESTLANAEIMQLAYDIGVSALLGEDVYSFSEFLYHPIFKYLTLAPTSSSAQNHDNTLNKDQDHGYIAELLQALHDGDTQSFEMIVAREQRRPLIQTSMPILSQKICLMALVDLAINKSYSHTSHNILTFQEIAESAKLPINEVEYLILKALALGLLKGTIDQLRQEFTVTWVLPRLMSLDQVSLLRNRLADWKSRVSRLSETLTATLAS